MNTCYRIQRIGTFKERVQIRSFKTAYELHRFLNKDDNSCFWHDTTDTQYEGLKRGTYAYAGGEWLNINKLDASELAHI